MTKTVVGLYDDFEEAQSAVQELVESGFARENISLAANDANGKYAQALDVQAAEEEEEGETAAKGAGIGAAMGGIAGLVVGLGVFVIPGIGPVLAAGPLLSTIGGAGVSAVTGGMIGALSETGVSGEDANMYAEGVRRGGTLLLAHVDDERADRAAEIMNRHHPINLEERAAAWQETGWQGFTEPGEQFAFGRQPRIPRQPKERAAESPLDYGPGARSYLAGQPVSEYDRTDADLSHYMNRPDNDYYMYESRFREDFKNTYAGSGKSWETYQLAYRFGFNQAHEPRYSNGTWDMVHRGLREDWERDFPGHAWADFENAIHEGWEVGHVAH